MGLLSFSSEVEGSSQDRYFFPKGAAFQPSGGEVEGSSQVRYFFSKGAAYQPSGGEVEVEVALKGLNEVMAKVKLDSKKAEVGLGEQSRLIQQLNLN